MTGAPGRDGLQLVADRGQRLPFDLDKLGGILGLGAALGDDHRDRLALPDRAVGREQATAAPNGVPGRCSATPTNGSHRGLMSAAVSTAATPGALFAASMSIDTTFACGCGLRTKQACSMRGSLMSSM